MATRSRAGVAVVAFAVLGASLASAVVTAPAPSIAAPERDSLSDSTGRTASADARSAPGSRAGRDGAEPDRTEPDDTESDRTEPRRTPADRDLLDDVRIGDAAEAPSWRWVLYQDLTTGEVRKYRVDADGRMTVTLPEESAAVEFLAGYLDRSVPLLDRMARIRPHLAPEFAARAMRDPFFRHPPATTVTGVTAPATARPATDPADTGDSIRTVFVGTDIGDYRVALSPAGPNSLGRIERTRADAASDVGRWEVHAVLPPASWLRPAAVGIGG
ncbi:hypothetical protein [Planctomonas psychrotolerans]|uniref:hypothetical protein n=1 Tax=Planctomonas psychrotolerans TaxID=2528712 RepID=UPI0012389524|nr:hypothetical protein [Planctomonas psychrotolerans]